MQSDLPIHVKAFLIENVRSLLMLDLLLLMRADSKRAWKAGDLARELRCGEDWVAEELPKLTRQRLLIEAFPASFCFNPAHAEADSVLGWVSVSYPEWRLSIIETIYGERTDPISSFADSFRLRKERTDG